MTIPATLAFVLGVVHGAASILPISGGGHVALLGMLFGVPGDPGIAAALNLGTLAATVLALRRRLPGVLGEGARGALRPSLLEGTKGGRDAAVVGLSTLTTAIVGLALAAPAEVAASSPDAVGLGLLASALAIGATQWAAPGDEPAPSHRGAMLVGALQGAAVLPGLSRTGLTIAALLFLGVERERAFELSFLVSIPALTGLVLLDARRAAHPDPVALVVAAVAAFALASIALAAVRSALVRRSVALFGVYLVPLGVATLAWAYARP